MPVARVQLPDGRVARLEVPEGTTPEQVESFVFNGMRDAPKEKPYKPEPPTRFERFGRGMADISEGLQQGYYTVKDMFTGGNEAEEFTRQKTDDLGLYERGRRAGAQRKLSDLVTGAEPDPGIDWMRLGGNLVATAPAGGVGGAATLAGRTALGAVQGATASGMMFTPEGESKVEQVVMGGALGGAAPAVFEGAKRAVSSVVRKAPPQALAGEIEIKLQSQGVDWNKLTQAAKDSLLADAKKALETGGTIDDAMLANKALIESVGAKGTKASVSRNPRDWQEQKNLRGIEGVGDDIVTREQVDAAAMIDYLQKLRQGTGGKTSGPVEAGESAITAIKTQDATKARAVDDLYQAYRDSGLKDAKVPETRLMDALTGIIDEVGQENIPAAVQSRLKDFGFLGGQRSKDLTVQQADLFNRLLNANNPGHGPQALVVGRLRGALNESLIETPGGGELLTKAREAAAQRFAEQRAGKGIAAAIDDVAPDRFVDRFVVKADVRDMRAVLSELKKSPQGMQAVSDMKGHVLDTLLLKATGATNVDYVAGKAFSGARFGKALDDIAPEKLHLLFKPDEVGALRTLQKASKLLTEEVPFSDVNQSKTAAALANLFLKIGNTPLLGQLVSPIIGTARLGLDWVKDANARKQVAEALMGSAVKSGERKLFPQTRLERLAPGATAAANQPREDE